MCDICGSATVLDPSSATELLTQIEPEVAEEKPQIPSSLRKPKEKIQEQSISRLSGNERIASSDAFCQSHPDEDVKYFCFDCLSPPVCSECVVHGIHKGHEVLHIKKAFPVVRNKLDTIIQEMSTRVNELEANNQEIQTKKKAVTEQAETAKLQMKDMLAELRGIIDKKKNNSKWKLILMWKRTLENLGTANA